MTTPFQAIHDRLAEDNAPNLLIRYFQRAYQQWADGISATLSGRDIEPVETLPSLDSLSKHRAAGEAALGQSVMIKLNGGLGTSMGLNKAKSLLQVKQGFSFLDIIARQILHLRQQHHVSIPLLFMNSFSTQADTLAALSNYPDLAAEQTGIPLDFLQNKVPKIDSKTGLPAEFPANPELTWCPPGHGDIYICLQTSGILDALLDQGYRYIFVSNADNLGAVFSPEILGYMAAESIPFLMEATRRTPADRKGGHLALSSKGSFLLRESAQCPEAETADFQNIDRYKYFNTNNLWLHLPALRDCLKQSEGVLPLPIMVNRKTVDPRNPDSTPVVQLETAMGSALGVIPGARAIDVPRTRFAPVKTTDDLLALRSDCFEIDDEEHIVPNPERRTRTIDIQLDPTFYKLIDDFEARFSAGLPSLLECERLSVKGDCYFSAGIRCVGDVVLENTSDAPVQVPADTVLTGSHSFSSDSAQA